MIDWKSLNNVGTTDSQHNELQRDESRLNIYPMEIPVLQLETTQKGVSLHHRIFIRTKIKRLVISTEITSQIFL